MKYLPIEPLESRIAPATLSISAPSLKEGDSGFTAFEFTVTLTDVPTSGNVTVNFHTVAGTATDTPLSGDFRALSGSLLFTLPVPYAATTTRTFTVEVRGDIVGEDDETFSAVIDMPSANATITTDTATATILNDAKLTVSPLARPEGNTGTTPFAFTVALTERAPTGDVTVDYFTADGANADALTNATLANNDYVQILPQALLFEQGTNSRTIAVQVVGDTVEEKNETFLLKLQNATGATVVGAEMGTATVTGTILTDTIQISSPTLLEGAGGVTNMIFQVGLSDYAGGYPVKVNYKTINGTAAQGQDYSSTTGTLTFQSGETSKTVAVPIYGDTTAEADETFTLEGTGIFAPLTPGGTTLANFVTTGTGTILNDEVSVSIADAATTSEGDTLTKTVTFEVTLTGAISAPVTIHYRTVNGTGDRGARDDAFMQAAPDFVGITDLPLTFLPGGPTTQTVSVTLNGDAEAELTENFQVQLFNPAAAMTITRAFGAVTITNDDSSASIASPLVAQTEGNSGTKFFDFPVTLTRAFQHDVVLHYKTVNDTATDGVSAPAGTADFVGVTDGTVTILATQTTANIRIAVRGDLTKESDEKFKVELLDPQSDTLLGTKTAETTIFNDDPGVSIGDVTVIEGDSGTLTALFTVTLSAAPAANETVTVKYKTADGTARSTADARQDFIALPETTLTFAAGETVKTIAVQVVGDQRYEFDENFFVNITEAKLTLSTPGATPTDYPIHDGQGLGTIKDTTALGVPLDAKPTLAIGPATGVFENGGAGAVFTVTLSAASDQAVTVNFATLAGTATVGDFEAQSGTLTFMPGETAKPITVVVNGDAVDEADETFQVLLSGAVLAGNGALNITQAVNTGTILNDDLTATIAAPAAVLEGATGATTMMDFTVTLSAISSHAVIVNYATEETGVALLGATAGSDFTAKTGSITIPAGSLTGTISIPILGDATDEADQQFNVKLLSVANARIGGADFAIGTITDDDAAPTVRIVDTLSTTEGNANTTANFTVSLSAASEKEITVKYATAPGTALSPADFAAVALTTLTFAPGETSKNVPVTINGDLLDEANETFTVTLSAPSATVTLDTAHFVSTATIVDNDPTPTLSIDDVSAPENTGAFTFKVRLSAVSGLPVTVTYSTLDSTAFAASDYTLKTDTLTFAPGVIEQTFTVAVTGDTVDEGDERFLARLSAPVNATVLDGEAVGLIQNDDNVFTIQNVTLAEEGVSDVAQIAKVRVSRTGTGASTVQFTTVDGTAKAVGARPDFTAKSGTLSFAAGETFKDIDVPIAKDAHYEFDEVFTVVLSQPAGGTIASGASGTGTVTITNNDSAPTLSVTPAEATEKTTSGFNTSILFTVQLSAANEREDVTVQFETMDGTAFSSGDFKDFNATAGELAFFDVVGAEHVAVTSRVVAFEVLDDTRDEDDQSFLFLLKNPNHVVISGSATVAGTIHDNDNAPTLSVNDFTLGENESGAPNKFFTATLSAISEKTVTVNWHTDDGAAGTTAAAGRDFTAVAATPLTFAPGTLTQTFAVQVIDDVIDEANETFEVLLDTPMNVTFAKARGRATITDNDAAPVVSINDVTFTEGSGSALLFTVSLSAPSGKTVTVRYATAEDGTATTSGPFADFMAKSGTLTFLPDETSMTIAIPIFDDVYREGATVHPMSGPDTILGETFSVKLTSPSNATLGDATGAASIENGGDTLLGLAVSDVAVVEGNSGTKTATFRVQLSAPAVDAVTFTAATRNSSAVAGEDYGAVDRQFTIAADATAVDVAVTIGGDANFEATESYFLDVTNVSANVVVEGGDASRALHLRGTIYNDDRQILDKGRTAQWIDVDGDLVTLTVTRGALDFAQFTFSSAGTVGGQHLDIWNVLNSTAAVAGTSITISADPQPGFTGATDGRVNVGAIAAGGRAVGQLQFRGIDLGNVTVDGDLGRIGAGDTFATPAIRTLDVYSLGTLGTASDLADVTSEVLGPIRTVHVHTDVGGKLSVIGQSFGTIGTVLVDGALKGGTIAGSGQVFATGHIGRVTVGELIGGSGASSGMLGDAAAGATIGRVTVLGGMTGGTGIFSGSIRAPRLGDVTVGGALHGGIGGDSGAIISTGLLGDVTVAGALVGGGGSSSGAIKGFSMGNVKVASMQGAAGTDSGAIVATNRMGHVTVAGAIVGGTAVNAGSIKGFTIGNVTAASLQGGTLAESGSILATSRLGDVTIRGAVVGGAGVGSGKIGGVVVGDVSVDSLTGGSGAQSGSIFASAFVFSNTGALVPRTGVLGNVTVAHDVVGGGGENSGAIVGQGRAAKVSVGGNLLGGSGPSSGSVATRGRIGSVSIVGGITGGVGGSSGTIIGSGGTVGDVTVGGALTGAMGDSSGKIIATRLGDVSVARILGGAGDESGSIVGTIALGKVTVMHEVTGGLGAASGAISGPGKSDAVSIGGDLSGGTGNASGRVDVGVARAVSIAGAVLGGAGSDSGSIFAAHDLKSLTIGKTAGDSIHGGAGVRSGRVVIVGDLRDASLSGTIRGGSANLTGGLTIGGRLTEVLIGGDIIGGAAPATGASITNSGFLQAGLLGAGTVLGSLKAGADGGAGLTNSGVIRTGRIDSLTIVGEVMGSATNPAVISAAATIDKSNVGIKRLKIEGKVNFAEILAGYDGLTTTSFRGQLTSADAQIGTVEIDGSVHGLNIVAGAAPGSDGRFGDATDLLASGPDVRDSARVISRIASIILKGAIVVNTDTFGIIAQHLVSVKLGAAGTPLAGLTKGAGNDTALGPIDLSDEIGAGTKFRAVEIAV